MDNREIIRFCLERGLLVDKAVLGLFDETEDIESVKLLIEKIKQHTNTSVITKTVFKNNKQAINELFFNLPEEKQRKLQKLKINLGLSIEISKEVETFEGGKEVKPVSATENLEGSVKIISRPEFQGKVLAVKDFVKYFNNRYEVLKNVLQEHAELDGLVSINKISGSRQNFSVIGLVGEKRVTKNKNMLLDIEDPTGKMRVLINKDKKELFEKALDIPLDGVIGFKGSGKREILFCNDLVFPETILAERKKAPQNKKEECALFIGDLHFGSKKFMDKEFEKFIDYLNGKMPNTDPEEISKIKYLFVVGDVVTGVGNYPNQEKDLKIGDLEEQFIQLSKILGKIRKDIKIIISPGNHDGVRLMEPQPALDEKYAWPLYNLSNSFLTTNPAVANIGSDEVSGFGGFDVLAYHGFSFPYYANNISSLIEVSAMNKPEEIMKFLLKNRHLAPTHASSQYFPAEEDPLLIKKAPDIFVAGHTHKVGIVYFNNILLVSVATWEEITAYQEKFGNKPDHCKVPMFNLKTREVKILDFE